VFFFSSRRRHTRFSRDWSSDVCSSDLSVAAGGAGWKYWVGPAAGLGISCWAVAATDFYLAVITLFLLTAALVHLGMVHGRALVRSEERRVGKEGRGRGGAQA